MNNTGVGFVFHSVTANRRVNNRGLLTAQPSKIEFLREKFEKSRDFACEKTKRDVGSEANSTARFVFSQAKSRLFEIFQVRTRFYEAGPAITHVLPLRPAFSRNEVGRPGVALFWGWQQNA